MGFRVRAWRAALLLVVLGGSSTAYGDDLLKAKELYDRAQGAFAASRYAEAVDLFDQAFAESHRPALLWNVAAALRREFEIDHDSQHLRRAREVYLNYTELSQSAADKQEAHKAIEEVDQQLAALAAPRTADAVAVAPPRPRRAWIIPGAVLLAGGVALGGAALGTGLAAKSDYDSLSSRCGAAMDQCPVGFQSTRDSGTGLEVSTWVLASVGGAAAITGAALLVAAVRRQRVKEIASLSPVVLTGGGGLAVRGSF